MTLQEEYNELIASYNVNKAPIVVVRFRYEDTFRFHLCGQLFEATDIIDEDGNTYQTMYAPMKVSDETGSNSETLVADRKVAIQGLNDYIRQYEDMVPIDTNIEEGIRVTVMFYMSDRDGVLSDIVEKLDYYLANSDYAEDSNTVTFDITTNPTNDSSTGEKATISKFITLKGFT
ncbi:hypothetical protein SIPHO054v2_p0014 [Vibrio phage 103E44.1]|nr:hypothetical protein SIPHO054v2_p0014 [Vibrio phage 103E44.1]QZI87870.1 hypothetical protein SIPHO055v2_p0014 [Vibrio phage 104E43.1]